MRCHYFVLILLAVLLGACAAQEGSAPSARNTPDPPSPPAIGPTAQSPISVSAYGITFLFDPVLGAQTDAAVVQGKSPEDADGFTQMVIPDFLLFRFIDSYGDDLRLYWQAANLETAPFIAIYPAQAYSSINELADREIAALRNLLADAELDITTNPPFLPTVNASRVLTIQPTRLHFQNGEGIRYLTQVGQEARPINNQELFYTFQGLTDDGACYVAAFFPVRNDSLPDDAVVSDPESFNINYAAYLETTAKDLQDIPPSDFMPALPILDQLIASIRVEPTGELFRCDTQNNERPPELSNTHLPPEGLIFSYENGLYRTDASGKPDHLSTIGAYQSLYVNPDATTAALMNDEGEIWLVDLSTGEKQQVAMSADLASLHGWLDSDTLLLGVWLNEQEHEGQSTGHLAALSIQGAELQVIEATRLSLGRPAASANGQTIAYDISPYYSEDDSYAFLFDAQTGKQAFDITLFSGAPDGQPSHLFNPSWSPGGSRMSWRWAAATGVASLVQFDLSDSQATELLAWNPLGFGALPPADRWSPDGAWLASEIWAANPESSGLWIISTNGGDILHISQYGTNPQWLDESSLIYAECDVDRNCYNRLFSLATRQAGELDMPKGTILYTPQTPPPPAANDLSTA